MVCTVHGKHSHSCIGRAQSIHSAVMQHTAAVGRCHMRPKLTNTDQSSLTLVTLKLCYKNVVFPTEPTIQGGCLVLLKLALCYCPNSCSNLEPPVSCRTLCRWLVTVMPQGKVKLHFHFCTIFLMLVCERGNGKNVEVVESCFSR
jgi:hypothetical protein